MFFFFIDGAELERTLGGGRFLLCAMGKDCLPKPCWLVWVRMVCSCGGVCVAPLAPLVPIAAVCLLGPISLNLMIFEILPCLPAVMCELQALQVFLETSLRVF